MCTKESGYGHGSRLHLLDFKSIWHPSTRILSEEKINKSNIMKLLRMAMEIQDWDGPAGGQDDVDETVNVRFVEDTQIGNRDRL